jgi:transposase-like protein
MDAIYKIDDSAARRLFEAIRWPTGAKCPHCESDAAPYRIARKPASKKPCRDGVWKCSACRKQFTVTVGTIFEGSHLPLKKLLIAIVLLSSEKGVSALHLSSVLRISYKTAWLLCHRINKCVAMNTN